MDKNAITLGLRIGRILAGQRKARVPVAYLYGPDKVRLPKLPEIEGCPNAVVVDAGGVYVAEISKSKIEAYNTGDVALIGVNMFKFADNQWIKTYLTSFPSVYPLIWTNYDLYYKTAESYGDLSGTLRMAASEPVPVYK